MATLTERFQKGWNAFMNREATDYQQTGPSAIYHPDKIRLHYASEKSVVASIYNRIAIDVASVSLQHVRVDENDRFIEEINSGLNTCLGLEANIDQPARSFIRDLSLSLFDEGVVAVVPVDTTIDPKISDTYQIRTMRVGQITEWFPFHVRVKIYNDRTGNKEEVILPKRSVAIIENPLYTVMNEPNGTLKRLVDKLALLDVVDKASADGKLDLIIQLPYVIKSEMRQQQAEKRRQAIEMQLKGSKYGIAYIDGTERITQLNRPVENNLLAQVKYLNEILYQQLGLTEEILKGTANDEAMINYYYRTVEPILSAIANEFTRKFLTKTAWTQGQRITFFRDPFRLVPINALADIADRFTRNEILSSNEVRAIIGFRPSGQNGADDLRNKNLLPSDPSAEDPEAEKQMALDEAQQNFEQNQAELNSVDEDLDDLEKQL